MSLKLIDLPEEVIIQLMKYLPISDIVRFTRVSKDCNSWLTGSNHLWLIKQKQLGLKRESEQADASPDMEEFLKLHRASIVKENWSLGRMSKVLSLNDLPNPNFCPMSAETWGEIFERELSRTDIV